MSVIEEGGRSAGAARLARWLARIAPASARGAVTVAILPDARVKALNRRFRRINKATDVLSFPAARAPGENEAPILGDIVIARGIARKQARFLKHSLETELRVLALHGLLHLLGYDHDIDGGRMGRVEGRLRRKAGLPLGLIARSS